jgi:signal transduction histidine kinase/ligand-binding sensor domain-containing protein/CheY-like chemotaxis protein
MTGYFCLISISILSLYRINAQTPGLSFKYLNTRNGLSFDDVRSIYQDKEGFMWFATERGVDRYAGKEFKNYLDFVSDSTFSMMQTVQQISGDSYNGIWYFDDTTGLMLMNKITKKVRRFVHIPGNPKTLSDNNVRNVIEDSDKNLWITTLGGGLNLFNRQDSTFRCFRHDSADIESIGSDRITTIAEDKNGMLWISSPDGFLIKFNRKSSKFTNIRLSEPNLFLWNNINSPVLLIDEENNIWFGNQRDLFKVDQKTGKSEKIPLEISSGTQYTIITSLVELAPNQLLIATSSSGLYEYNSLTGKTNHYLYSPANPFGINSNRLSQIFRSKDGVIWIGSFDNGINIYSKNSLRFPQFLNLVNIQDLEYANYSTYSLCELPDGTIVIGTENNGLMEYNPKTNRIKRIIPELRNVSIFDMQIDEKGKIWMCSWIYGFYCYDTKTGKLQKITRIPGTDILLTPDLVRFHLDSKNRYWFGSIRTGLTMVDIKTGSNSSFAYDPADSNSLRDNLIFKIFEDSYGNIWIGTSTGLHLYDDLRNTIKRIRLTDEINKSEGLMIFDIFEDHKKQLWIGTSKSLYLLNRRTLKSKSYSHKSNNTFISAVKIFEDDQHMLWLGTNAGVYSFNPEAGKYRDYGISDGTYYLENNPNAGLKSRSGYFYFGTAKGVTVFNPNSIIDDTIPPPIYITYIGVNDVEIDLNGKDISYSGADHIDHIKLKYKQSTLEIRFASLNYNNTEANQFQYQLSGFDKTWVKAGNSNIAYYPNLPPGKYTFRVIASNSHGYWNNTGKQVFIHIAPPLWKRLWFRVLVPLILMALFFIRVMRLRQKKMQLESLVKVRTKALNDANTELKEQHEELLQQHEEITTQNERLSQMSEEILMQNAELEQHRTNLEKLVEDRTMELELAFKKAEESDRLKSAFLANMSHEIRTPMNAIVGFANLLKDDELDPAEKVDFIEVINSNSETLLVLIDDILDLSLIEANQLNIKKDVFSINEMLDQLCSSYSLMNRKKELEIKLNNELHDRNLSFFSDRIRIKQVLTNLLNNAYKFTEKGTIELGLIEQNKKLSFYVKDSGIGIDAKDLAHIFERFRKSDSGSNFFYRGTGLGLAISKALAHLLNGELGVESEAGQGSVFRFTLPWSIVSTDEKIPVPNPIQKDNQKWSGRDILIVEDEEANYLYAKKVLSKLKVNIHWAENGEEAVRLTSSGQDYHIILMDIKMPVMDGFEATKIIKTNNPKQVVIALTAYARPEDRIRFMQAGFDDYLAKPIKPNDILGVIRRYL